uniref:Peptidase S1 and S6 chymotrypsin/Hap n=1 Tax=Caulobacter sp. (strain K31) TaxID=366602 RepID=B0T9I0_CAUSK
MTNPDELQGPDLLFTEAEWTAVMPKVCAEMTDYLRRYRTPVFIDHGDHGSPHGSGSFLEVAGRKFVLTNEHVAAAKRKGNPLGVRFHDQDQLLVLMGDHVEATWPWDLALLPVSDEGWSKFDHSAAAIQIDQIALAHAPYPTEVLAFSGYAGERTTFVFETMQFGATTSLAREVALAAHADLDERFHFGMAYLPDLATSVVGDRGLPRPPGLSGSTVWNTGFVEAKAKGVEWTPELAKVTGVVWGWPTGQGAVVATRAEHLRSFLLGATSALAPLES